MKKNILFLFVILIFTKIFAQEKSKEYKSPCLWVNTAQIIEIKKHANDPTLKRLSYTELIKQADKYLNEPLDIPQQGGNWEQYFVSPITNNVLQRGKLIGNYKWEYTDPITKQVFVADNADIEKDYDGVVIGFITIPGHWV